MNLDNPNLLPSKDGASTLLIYTRENACLSHGTGSAILKELSFCSQQKVLNVFTNYLDSPGFKRSVWITPSNSALRSGLNRLRNSLFRSRTLFKSDLEKAPALIESLGFSQSVLYACCFNYNDLLVVHALLSGLPNIKRAFLYFLDFLPEDSAEEDFNFLLSSMVSDGAEVWTLSKKLADKFNLFLPKRALVTSPFLVPYKLKTKPVYRPASKNFRACILGNFYPFQQQLIKELNLSWRRLRSSLGLSHPIDWYCSPAARATRTSAWDESDMDQIRYLGFLPEKDLLARLQEYDAFIVPFNLGSFPNNHYERYSIPSKMMSAVWAGLPVLFVGGENTEAGQFVSSRGFGLCSDISNKPRFEKDLHRFVTDAALRERLGTAGQNLCDTEFDLTKRQAWLANKFWGNN